VTTFVELLGRILASSFDGVWAGSDPAALIALAGMVGAMGLLSMVAASRVRSVGGVSAALRVHARRLRQAEPADRSALLGQSDPDADGRPRPRAPGSTLPAA
jgi:hypothetical protein